jgi:hypothetical protein
VDGPQSWRVGYREPGGSGGRGRAVQVIPIKPTLKAPGTKRSKLQYDELLSSFAFNFNLRRYSLVGLEGPTLSVPPRTLPANTSYDFLLTVCYSVGRCRLTLSNPR